MNMLLANADATGGKGAEDIGGVLLFGAFVYFAMFAWLTISGWARQRRKERESFYRHEVEKKIVEAGGATAEQLAELRRDEAYRQWMQRREGLKLAGLIVTAVGVGLLVAMRFVIENKPVYHVAWIPIAVGSVMLVYVLLLCPRFTHSGDHRPT